MKKGIGRVMVWGSYLTTMRNSVTVIAATSHACCPNFLWNFLRGRLKTVFTTCAAGAHFVTSPMRSARIPKNNSRVIHEVIDFPHCHASNIHKKDETQKHQVVLWRHPQHKLQVEGIQLRQEELERGNKTMLRTENVWVFFVINLEISCLSHHPFLP